MRPPRQNAAGLTGIYLPEDVVIMLDELGEAALGHGVSWFDDHADFPLKLPSIETMVNVDNRGRLFFTYDL